MKIEASPSILRRKLRSEPASSTEQAITPAKAARLSLARAADKAFDLEIRVIAIRQSRLDLADMVERIHEDWAIYPLLNDDGSVGVICMDPASVIAFVESQTMRRINPTSDEQRSLTQTDKALAAGLLDVFFALFDDALEGAPTAYWTRSYRAEDAVSSKHMMVLRLEASEYRGFDISIDVPGHDRTLSIRLFLPIKERELTTLGSKNAQQKSKQSQSENTSKTMRSAALAANVELDAVMCKISLPLSELNDLALGQLIPLPQNASSQAHLVDKAGHSSRAVHLGQLHGMRAVRIVYETESERPMLTTEPEVKQEHVPKVSSPDTVAAKPSNAEPVATTAGDDLDALLAPASA